MQKDWIILYFLLPILIDGFKLRYSSQTFISSGWVVNSVLWKLYYLNIIKYNLY